MLVQRPMSTDSQGSPDVTLSKGVRTSDDCRSSGLKIRPFENTVGSPLLSIEMFALLTEFSEKRRCYCSVVDRFTELDADGQAAERDIKCLSFSKKRAGRCHCRVDILVRGPGRGSQARCCLVPKRLVAVPLSPFSGLRGCTRICSVHQALESSRWIAESIVGETEQIWVLIQRRNESRERLRDASVRDNFSLDFFVLDCTPRDPFGVGIS